MIIPPKEFFQFCSKHATILRELEQSGNGTELSEPEINNIVRDNSEDLEQQPVFVVKRLKELRILISTGEGNYFLLAEPVRAVLRYLLEDAKPVSSEIVQSYVNRLQNLSRNLRDALKAENPTLIELSLSDATQTLRSFYDAVSATHASVLGEVARFKTDKRPGSIREKYERIIWWMHEYITPMVDIIRVDGPMQATFAELEQTLEHALSKNLFIPVELGGRNLRLVRLARRHALDSFEQSEKEISPLYRSIARSSNLAAGAAWALDQLRLGTFEAWTNEMAVGIFNLRWQDAFSDRAINRAVERVLANPPGPPPQIQIVRTGVPSVRVARGRWLKALPTEVKHNLPIHDLLEWLLMRYPDIETSQILAGISLLHLDKHLRFRFREDCAKTYVTSQHLIHGHAIEINASK